MLGISRKHKLHLRQSIIAIMAAIALVFLFVLSDLEIVQAENEDLIFDNFTDRDGTPLSDHAPTIALEGQTWRVARGNWQIDGNKAVETFGLDPDARALIEAGRSDVFIRAKLIWKTGFVGVVFRYEDENNWIMAWFDGVEDVVLGKKVEGEFIEVARTSFDWGDAGRQRQFEVAAIGDDVTVLVSGRQLLRASISDLTDQTIVGLFSRNSTENRFSDFRVIAASRLGEPISTPEPEGPVVMDSFDDDENTKLIFHSPNIAPEGSSWAEVTGVWMIEPENLNDGGDDENMFEEGLANQVTEVTGLDQDNRAIIETKASNLNIQSEITWRGGFVGLAARYSDENNWIMAWFDGVHDVVIGKRLDGEFNEVARVRFEWGEPGRTRTFHISTNGEDLLVSVDNEIILNAGVQELIGSTKVGIFSRIAAGSAFDNFEVNAN